MKTSKIFFCMIALLGVAGFFGPRVDAGPLSSPDIQGLKEQILSAAFSPSPGMQADWRILTEQVQDLIKSDSGQSSVRIRGGIVENLSFDPMTASASEFKADLVVSLWRLPYCGEVTIHLAGKVIVNGSGNDTRILEQSIMDPGSEIWRGCV